MSTFYDSKNVMVHWDKSAEAVTMQWKRPAQYQAFRDGLEVAIGQVGQTKAHRVIADHSMLNLQDEDEAFFLKQWVPRAGQVGVKRLALVVERRQFVQIPKTRLVQKLKSCGLLLHYFNDMDQARIWVKQEEAAA